MTKKQSRAKNAAGVKGKKPAQKNSLIKDSIILFTASTIVNLLNFVFHIYATNKLGAENYGVLVTLLGLIIIVMMPAAALQMAVVKNTAAYTALKKYGSIKALFDKTTMWFLVLSAFYFGLFMAGSGYIMDFFKITDRALMLILAGIALVSLLLPVVRGILQGMQKFISLGINLILDSILRLCFLILAVSLGWGVRGALSASLFSSACAYVVGLVIIFFLFRYKEKKNTEIITKKEFFGYVRPVFLANLGFWSLGYIDVFMVKHFFSEHEAGLYSVTSIIGKAFLFFSAAIVTVLFPKVSEGHALKTDTTPMLYQSLGMTAIASTIGIAFCLVFPQFVSVFGKDYSDPRIIEAVKVFGIAITPLVLLNVILNYGLAKHKYKFVYAMYAGIILYIAMLWQFHSSFMQVLTVLFFVNLSILAASVITMRLEK